MSEINTEYLQKCIDTLEKSYKMLQGAETDSIEFEMYRNSLIKSFEMTIEQSGKLLRKKITPYLSSKKAADQLVFKDIFRYAQRASLLTDAETERWMKYRDNRNNIAHDYGQAFAEETLTLMESFLADAKSLKEVIDNA
ncbi:MAG: nucleotidyltransferase substrate binding protein [Lachnospiraceae bacterium]|nr:nucleotidyltransferase substrate binding protein [Lachnospiraceae bacterium]